MTPKRILFASMLAAVFALPGISAHAGAPQAGLPSEGFTSSPNTGSTLATAGNAYEMTTAESRLVFSNIDGTVTRGQFLSAMERRWDLMEKNANGELAAARGLGVEQKSYGPKASESQPLWQEQPEHILNLRSPVG